MTVNYSRTERELRERITALEATLAVAEDDRREKQDLLTRLSLRLGAGHFGEIEERITALEGAIKEAEGWAYDALGQGGPSATGALRHIRRILRTALATEEPPLPEEPQ